MPGRTSSVIDRQLNGNRVVVAGLAAIVVILLGAAILLFFNLPDANAFNQRVERIFVENDGITSGSDIKLLEILALSGTAFAETLMSYRMVISMPLTSATWGNRQRTRSSSRTWERCRWN